MSKAIDALEEILKETKSVSRIDPARIARSFYYDPTYSFALISCILNELGKQSADGKTLSMNSTLVRFNYFCAVRPFLIENLKKWSDQGPSSPIELTDFVLLPHAYLMDSSSSDAILFLLSSGNLMRSGPAQILLDRSNDNLLLNRLYSSIVKSDLLVDERRNLATMKDLKITLKDLGIA